ncbi:rCG63215 [Rattus norvegicus]|uniref:RCG63215 n=1 Tax=Rattus norvegicus TaxID=10116 RepID=A6JRD4_RAT|nr:rCG63215 [Rattus norvegicus]
MHVFTKQIAQVIHRLARLFLPQNTCRSTSKGLALMTDLTEHRQYRD